MHMLLEDAANAGRAAETTRLISLEFVQLYGGDGSEFHIFPDCPAHFHHDLRAAIVEHRKYLREEWYCPDEE